MKLLRAKQARALGILGATAVVLFSLVLAIIPSDIILKSSIAAFILYFLWLGYEGLTATWIAIDDEDVLVKNSDDYIRIAASETTRVRTFPIFRYVDVLTFSFENGMKTRTMVSDQDLTWIMSRMPITAITPYWRKKIGQQAAPSNR